MQILFIVTALCLLASFIANRQKTWKGVKKGMMMFFKLLPTLLTVIILVSIVLFLTPNSVLLHYFGKEAGAWGYISAAVIGSVALIPGFIAFPLAGMLVKSGVSYAVISVFVTTLMMVGFITLPVEAKFLGFRVALTRNILSFFGALLIGSLMAIIFSLF